MFVCVCPYSGVHAMGGMAAQIPIKDDPAANAAALAKVRHTYGPWCRAVPVR